MARGKGGRPEFNLEEPRSAKSSKKEGGFWTSHKGKVKGVGGNTPVKDGDGEAGRCRQERSKNVQEGRERGASTWGI